jgi:curved DNA-binding protein
MPDHYATLGVARTADDDEIKRAFRKLAMKHHPDRGGDQVQFQQINEAYSVLSDPARRREYDNPQKRVHINVNGHPHSGQSPFDFNDIFEVFGARFNQPQRQQPMARMTLWISLADVAQGGERIVSVGTPQGQSNIEINIPSGIMDGESVRYPELAPGKIDLVITYRIRPDQVWTRQGDNVSSEVSVSVWDLILGGQITLKTLQNTDIVVVIPPNTQPGTTMRVRGHGLLRKNTSERGDIMVRVQGRLPDNISDDLLEHIRKTRDQ